VYEYTDNKTAKHDMQIIETNNERKEMHCEPHARNFMQNDKTIKVPFS